MDHEREPVGELLGDDVQRQGQGPEDQDHEVVVLLLIEPARRVEDLVGAEDVLHHLVPDGRAGDVYPEMSVSYVVQND